MLTLIYITSFNKFLINYIALAKWNKSFCKGIMSTSNTSHEINERAVELKAKQAATYRFYIWQALSL